MMITTESDEIPQMLGPRVLVLNWRDIEHPQAGGAEQYMHQIASRWVRQGLQVSWITSRGPKQTRADVIDGIHLCRVGGPLSLYPSAAWELRRARGAFDVVIDCQNGIPFFAPAFVAPRVPVVQVVHHVHQDQFAARFTPPVAALGRLLEGRVARRVYGPRAVAAVSPSTRHEIRTRLGFRGPIYVVPNGTIDLPKTTGPRNPDPTVTVVSRLVPHKRIDFLLGQVANVVHQVPRLRVDIIGDGSERPRLQKLVTGLGLHDVVTLHGHLSDEKRDSLLRRAWLTTVTSAAEGWGCTVIEAAAWGLPCVALPRPGIRDSVIDGRTGWLVESHLFGAALVSALTQLAEDRRATEVRDACRAWAQCFSWDRSAKSLAGVVVQEAQRIRCGNERRYGRADISTVVQIIHPYPTYIRRALRATDEVVFTDRGAFVLLHGCDEMDATTVLQRLGISDAKIRLARRQDLLAFPYSAFEELSLPVPARRS